MESMKGARVLLIACCVAALPVSAELDLQLVTTDAARQASPTVKADAAAADEQQPVKNSLHWAAFNGDEALVREFLASGAGVDERIEKGGTPLHLAAYNGHTRVAELLIGQGADVNAKTNTGFTPLDWAQRNGHEEIASLLIAHGAKTAKVAPAPSANAPPPRPQNDEREDPAIADASDRQVPLKYRYFLVPQDTLVVNGRLKNSAPPRQRPVPEVASRIQLGAYGSERRAVEAWERYRKKYPELLGQWELIQDTVVVKDQTYHRVQTGPMSRQDAWAMCDQLKKLGQACAVMRQGTP